MLSYIYRTPHTALTTARMLPMLTVVVHRAATLTAAACATSAVCCCYLATCAVGAVVVVGFACAAALSLWSMPFSNRVSGGWVVSICFFKILTPNLHPLEFNAVAIATKKSSVTITTKI